MKIDYGRRTKTADSLVSNISFSTQPSGRVPVTFVFSRIKRFRDPSRFRLYPIRNRFSNSRTRIFVLIFFYFTFPHNRLPTKRSTDVCGCFETVRAICFASCLARTSGKKKLFLCNFISCCVWRRREGKNTQFVFSNAVKFYLFFRWTSR